MKVKDLRRRFTTGDALSNAFLTTPSPWTAELMANAGYDTLTIDMQHGLMDFNTTLAMLQAIGTTKTLPFARLPWNDPAIAMKVLDAGVAGVICPMIETAGDTRRFVRACRFPPEGYRSYGPIRARLLAGDDFDDVFCFGMIETASAVENLGAIAATPGLDGLFVGPYDLSVSVGLETVADFNNTDLLDILHRVLDACRDNNLVPGIFTTRVEDAGKAVDMGFRFVANTDDTTIFNQAIQARVEALRKVVGR